MHVILHVYVTCMFGCTCLYSFKDQPEEGSSGSTKPVLTQRLSPLMFQHLQLSHTQQPTLEGLFLLALEFYSSALTIPSHMEQVTMFSWMLVSSEDL